MVFCNLLGTLCGILVSAADFQKGREAYDKGDYATALREFTTLAGQNHADAQFSLGLMYDDGRGVAQDDKQAVQWYKLAAGQGDADAQFNLGNRYADGEGVAQDDSRAHMWFDIAASGGDEAARKTGTALPTA